MRGAKEDDEDVGEAAKDEENCTIERRHGNDRTLLWRALDQTNLIQEIFKQVVDWHFENMLFNIFSYT